MSVPVVKNISFYSNVAKQQARFDSVSDAFKAEFGAKPTFFARAPGRVNLIGEHIDYCHFSVLPMAIEVDVIAAVAPSAGDHIRIANTNTHFTTEQIPLPTATSTIEINNVTPLWADYFKCGLLVARKYMVEKKRGTWAESASDETPMNAFDALFDGNVPTGGGLSSSAAFCIAATLAALRANGVADMPKADLTEITVVCEHYVGLSNGGMDQSASINGEDSKVLLISFKPKLSAVPFQLPPVEPELVFLITNSLITANKTETAPTNYNLRVVEVAIAADIIAKKFGLEAAQDLNLQTATLRGVFDAYFEKLGEPKWDGIDVDVGSQRLERMLELVETLYSDGERNGLTAEEAATRLGLTAAAFEQRYLSQVPVRYELLNIYRRTRHVYSDALRVLQLLHVAREFSGDSQDFFKEVGALMDESQVSTRDYNQASAPGCDELCRIGRENGSYGSRVTGAGFGGCIVHLTTVDKVDQLVEAVTEKYYRTQFPNISDADIADAIVVSKPAKGACIIALE